MTVAYGYMHVQISLMLFWVDVLITQYFENSLLTEIECRKYDMNLKVRLR